jgi:Cd2+/Zn2+-exporting ATPase
MSATPKADALRNPDSGKCLARSVAQALAEDPTLEAVTVDQAHHTISVATLGKTDVPKLTERISATVQQAEESDAVRPCTLLAGETTCQTCGQPLSEFERRKITISREADTTTIARHCILFRGGAAVEKLAGVNTVALDKTGTLTTGELRVEVVESFPPGREAEVAQLAFSLERLSTHPLARAITRHGKQQGLQALELADFESITGQGLRARRNGDDCLLGRREWLAQGSHAAAIAQVPPTEPGFSEIWLAEGALLGRLILRDDIRPQARSLVDELHREGLRAVVLTGDRKATAEHLQRELGIQDVRAELKPEEKLATIRSLTEQGKCVAMVGDGVNDAPSLAAAHIGVAMGARGSDAALEQADVVLMHDRLENFLAAFRLSQRARRVIRQNLVISLGTVVVLVTFAILGRIPLTVGVVGHEGSTVIVVMNSLRLLFGAARLDQNSR